MVSDASTFPVDADVHLREVASRLEAITKIVDGTGLEDVAATDRLFFAGQLASWARLHVAVIREWA